MGWFLPALAAIGTTALDTIGGQANNAMNQRRSMKNWYKQQEYNTPKNQMNRLREAGINPHLAFSSGISNVATSPPETPMGSISPNVMGNMSMAKGMQKTDADIKNVNAKTALTSAQEELTEYKSQGQINDNVISYIDSFLKSSAYEWDMNENAPTDPDTFQKRIQKDSEKIRMMNIQKWQAEKAVQVMTEELAGKNMTPGDDLIARIAIALARHFGIEVPESL